MMTFRANKLHTMGVPMNLVRLIAEINEFKGKQDLYKQQSPQVLDALRQVAVIQSTESSNAIENIKIEAKRLMDIVEEKTIPRNRSENEIAGYRDVLATIHASHDAIDITPGIIRQLHRDMYKFSPGEGGNWKPADNNVEEIRPDGTKVIRFKPVPAHLTPEAMEELCSALKREKRAEEIDPLILTGVFVLDFLCIHPFRDGNGRMARLLTLLLLYTFGYEVGRYISLEKLVEKTKESYYDTLYISSQGWHEGEHNIIPWLEYLLGIILAAYRDFANRVGSIDNSKGVKNQRIKEAIEHFLGDFTFADIVKACPDASRPTIYRTLKELKEAGQIIPIGVGRNAKWRKCK